MSSSDSKNFYILSEMVDDFRELPKAQSDNFVNTTYTGLGQAVMCSFFLQEIDLKPQNIGLDKEGRIIKIDGDWSFAGDVPLYRQKEFEISPEVIARLPYPEHFYAFNWLGFINVEAKLAESAYLDSSVANHPVFRKELNEAMLKILLIPQEYLQKFVEAIVPANAQHFLQIINNRRGQLYGSAMQNQSFLNYLSGAEPNKLNKHLIEQIDTMRINGHHETLLNKPEQERNQETIFKQLEIFKAQVLLTNIQLIHEIKQYKVSDKDELIES